MRKLLVLLLFFFSSIGLFAAHPIYISVTEVAYDAKAKAYELSIRCFADDVEKALSEWFGKPITLEKEMAEADKAKFVEYMLTHIQFSRNEDPMKERFIGYELDNDVVFCYVEIEVGRKALPISIENSLLLESIPEQENIMHFSIGEKKESFRFNLHNRSEDIED